MFEKLFGIRQKKSSLKNEIIGGIFTFVVMCYILPVNAQMLSDPNGLAMDKTGVFIITALASCAVCLFMGFFANIPMALSAGMGINAFLAYTVSSIMGASWQQSMIVLTISGILFFILSLTPLRKIIIEAIPKELKAIISAALGGFIMFVGLKGSGIIAPSSSTLVTLGNLGDPAILVAIIAVFITIGFMFSKVKILSTLAIPFGILIAAVGGLVTSEILISTGSLVNTNRLWQYTFNGPLQNVVTNLPIAPWRDADVLKMFNPLETFSTIPHVFMYGLFDGYPLESFGGDFVSVFTNPGSYIAIFSLIFVSLFVSTATLITVGSNIGLITKDGKMVNYKRAVIADATGALIAAPLGTSSITCFAESNVGVSLGARTGLAAIVTGLMFLLSTFIFPVFSIFIAGSVTVPALVCVGLLILKGGFESLDFKNPITIFTALIMTIFCILTYSISDGIGIGLIAYVIMMLFAKKGKEVGVAIYVITGLFVVAFVASTIIKFI